MHQPGHFSEAGRKARRAIFQVLIGYEEFFYNRYLHILDMRSFSTYRRRQKNTFMSPLSIDLHGFTKEEALQTITYTSSILIDAAMEEHTCTFQVNTIRGGGGQLFSKQSSIGFAKRRMSRTPVHYLIQLTFLQRAFPLM